MIVRWSQRAATELFEAGDYLAAQRPGLDDRLYDATRRLAVLISDQPRAFEHVEHRPNGEIRRALLEEFQHWVLYQIGEAHDECRIVSFCPTRRKLESWRRRR